jgi:PAS domain-containing protein
MYFKFRKTSQKEQIANPKSGTLKIEVPHWAAEVRVYNSLLQPVAEVGKIKPDGQTKSGYSLEAILEPGIYQVQTSLEGETESEWIPVNSRKVTVVSPKAWEKLRFTSASPLRDIDNFNKTHTAKASELSRKITWRRKSGEVANSRLFLFVRTLDPKTYGETFSDGLQLLDATGEVVTDFSEDIKINKKQGWMAFNADLPSGGYILRRGRSGVRLRYQVFYLCEGWETQVFLKSRNFPSLSTWSLNMALKGNGFRPENEAVLAAEAITDNLRYGSSSLFLLQNEKIKQSIDVLLDEKMENPWLGVLAAHAILRLREQTQSLRSQVGNIRSRKSSEDNYLPEQLEEQILQAEGYFAVFEHKVKPFLHRAIGEHPDVRALMLSDDFAAGKPFDFPPCLLAGVQRVQSHSLKFTDTIPLDGLTDCVVDSLVVNAPWTAWRHLARQPKYDLSPQAKRLQIKQSGGITSDFSVSAVLSQAAAPRTPIYRFTDDETPPAKRRTATQTVLQDAPMIQKAKEAVIEYSENLEMSSLPGKINFNSTEEINKVLAQVTPEEVSRNFGISLSRTEESLKYLHSQTFDSLQADEPTDTSTAATNKSLVTVQQAILEYALNKFGKTESETTGGAARTLPKYTIREIVIKIQCEADRLCIAATASSSGIQQTSGISIDAAFNFAERLYAVAETLLKYADFVLITDSRGKILYSNGAFLLLVSPKSSDRAKATEREITEARLTKQKEWEKILEAVQIGLSDVENSSEPEGWRKWKLSRTEIEDQAGSRSISYLNLLRLVEFPPLDEEILCEIDSAAANLSFYAPLLIYGSAENKEENEKNLRKTIEWLEAKVK